VPSTVLEVRRPPPQHAWLPTRSLLDVNVWIALLDDARQFSAEENAFVASPETRIATCPLVENGVIRVMGMPSYGRGGGLPTHLVRQRLQQACAELDHAFWPDDVSLRDDALVDFSRIQGHQQVADL
jgi:predicted nucleic acid-binding protein